MPAVKLPEADEKSKLVNASVPSYEYPYNAFSPIVVPDVYVVWSENIVLMNPLGASSVVSLNPRAGQINIVASEVSLKAAIVPAVFVVL